MTPEQLGPYKIDSLLGRGGMGAVYKATHVDTGEPAAVKVLAAQYADEPHFRGRFAIEVETLKKLDHPNIVSIFGFGEEGDQLFYAMELVDGVNLFQALREGRVFTIRQVVEFAQQVCQALRHAHDRGIVHRDLKPANLMLDSAGNMKLTDFGIAKLFGASQMTAAGGVLGTADYMAPEQAEGKAATIRSDLYSLGSVIFAILARRAPFAAKSLPEVLHKLRYEEAPPLQKFAPETPNRLAKLVSRLLEKDPQRRIGTAVAVSKRLAEIAAELPPEEAPQIKEPEPDTRRKSDDDDFTLEENPQSPSTVTPQTEWSRPTAPDPPKPEFTDKPKVKPADAPTAVPLTQVTDSGKRKSKPAEALRTAVSSGPRPTAKTNVQIQNEAAKTKPPAQRLPDEASPSYTPIEEARNEDEYAEPEQVSGSTLGFALLGVVGVLVVGAMIYFLIPRSRDTLYEKIELAAAAKDSRELLSVQPEIDEFLSRFPADERADEVRNFAEEADMLRGRRRFENNARKAKRSHSIDPAAEFYLQAIDVADDNPQRAISLLQSLVGLYKGQKDSTQDTKTLVSLAEDEIKRLKSQAEANTKRHAAFIKARLEEAKSLEKTDLASARAIWNGIYELYKNEPGVKELVAEARQELSRTEQ